MTDGKHVSESARQATVKIGVEREMAPQFAVGTRWEVIASSLDSLWYGPYTVTLRRVEDGGGEEGSE